MRKIFVFSMVVTLLVGFSGIALADDPAPGGPFSSAFNIQNLTADEITCAVTYYNAAGGEAGTSDQLPATIAGNDKAYVYVPSEGSLADGQYSAEIACSGEAAAVSNFSDQPASSTEASGASYSGIRDSETAEVWYTPNVYNDYYDFYTNIVVQNAGDSATGVTVRIYDGATLAHTMTIPDTTNTPGGQLAAKATYTFQMEGLAQLTTNKGYSAEVAGDTGASLAVITNIYGRANYNEQLYSFNPFTAGSTEVYAPVIMNDYYDYNTDFAVQNLGDVATHVTITYYWLDGTTPVTATQEFDLEPKAAQGNYTPASPVPSTGNLVVTAKAESDGQPIVGIVNESHISKNRAASYSAVAGGTTSSRAPIIYKFFYGYNTSITCMNVGGTAEAYTVNYVADTASGTSATAETTAAAVAPMFGAQFYQPANTSLQNGYNGAAEITSSSQPFACIINEDISEGSGSGWDSAWIRDVLFTYNAVQ